MRLHEKHEHRHHPDFSGAVDPRVIMDGSILRKIIREKLQAQGFYNQQQFKEQKDRSVKDTEKILQDVMQIQVKKIL